MENPSKMDDLGGKPTIFGNTHMIIYAMYMLYIIYTLKDPCMVDLPIG